MDGISRRATIRSAVWGVPVISMMATAPVFAASTDPIIGIVDGQGSKCPGKSTDDPNTVIITFLVDQRYVSDFTDFTVDNITKLTVNGIDIPVQRVVVEGIYVHVVTVPRENSADASGRLIFDYTIHPGTPQQQKFSGNFTYSGTHPNQALCKRI